MQPTTTRYLRLVVAVLVAAEALTVPQSSFFVWLIATTNLGGLALMIVPKDRRWLVPATVLTLTMLRPMLGLVLYTNEFWHVIFVGTATAATLMSMRPTIRNLRLVAASLLVAFTLAVPLSSFFVYFVGTMVLVGLASLIVPDDRRWFAPVAVVAAPMLRPALGYVFYTDLFWYVVFVPVVALVCTVVTEWVRWRQP